MGGGLVMAATLAHYYSKPPSSVCRLYTLLLSRPASAPGSDLLHAVSQVRDCSAKDVSSAKAATAVAIWGAALHAMQCLMYRLREDGETFTSAAAVNAARHRLSAAASADYWWIENQHEWLRDGGARAHPTRTTTRAAWDQKWSGLQRRTPHKVAGHEAADGGATSDGWLHQEEQRTCRRNSIA